MKVKIKLDKEAVKQFAILHAEKFVFGLVTLLFLVFVYSALNRERWPSGPETLSDLAKAALKHVHDTPDKKGLRPVPPVLAIARQESQPISNRWYQLSTPFSPLPPQKQVRERPDILPLEKPVATAGSGAFTMQDPAAAPGSMPFGATRGQRWVVVTGLLPVAQQKEKYAEALKATEAMIRGSNAAVTGYLDTPVYVYYRIERAEVTGAENPATVQWAPIHVRRAFAVMWKWRAGGTREVVAPKYLHTLGRFPMAFPLGPLVNANWGPEVAHEPEIPIMSPAEQMGAMPSPAAKDSDAAGKKGKEKEKLSLIHI